MSAVTTHEPRIVPVMVGTAGHVDHGKTALVKLLTGCDTDTLPEEKKRGLSIDLGFAPFMLNDSRMVGIIDVPGHEDFIRNMVAGASSIDVLILVIAADDGIMPQTIEHLKIVSLLRTPQVMAVITKIDLSSSDRQEEVKQNVKYFLKEHGYPEAPVVPESNKTCEGIGEVRETINQLVENVERRHEDTAFRMDVERVFSVQGYGTVATGIPSSGRCAAGDELDLFPGPRRTVCRAIQKYSRASQDTEAHVCSAINIRGVEASDIKRGMTLTAPGVYRQTARAIISVRNVHESASIKLRQEIRFCCGTSARVVSALLIGSQKLGPGESGFMQIKLPEPAVLAAGDRFILRSLSPSATIAGGVVLTINGDPRKKKPYLTAERLQAAQAAALDGDVFLSELIAGNSAIISRRDLPFLLQSGENGAKKALAEKIRLGIIMPIGPAQWIVKDRLSELEDKLKDILTQYHKENKVSRGMPAVQVCAVLGLDTKSIGDLQKILGARRVISANNDCFSLKEFKPELSAKQQSLKEKIAKSIFDSGKSAIAAATLQAQTGAGSPEMQLLLRLLSEEGSIVILDEHLIRAAIVVECLDKLLKLFETGEIVELKAFREAAGLSRNVAVPMLEYFDSKGITCRVEKGRKLLRKP